MAVLLTARVLAKSFGPRMLFRGVSFSIDERERIGLVGPNGSGKSTLLKIIARAEEPDDGRIEFRRGLRVGYVAQQPDLDPEQTIEEAVVGDDPHNAEVRRVAANVLISKIGLPDASQRIGTLSGGALKRVAIAKQLVDEPDLLLLDEPTNHLDYDAIRWLERQITGSRAATLLVSHDRAFLEATTTRTIELDRVYPDGLLSVAGPYSEFAEQRELFLEAQRGQQRAVASRVRREVEWLKRGAKARGTKAKGRIQQAAELSIELDELKQRNAASSATQIDFAGSARQTRKLLQFRGVSKSLGGRSLFSDVNLVLSPGDKLGVLGANGAGKSTMLKLITGDLMPDGGEVSRADRLNVVVFDQHREQLNPTITLRRALSPMGDNLTWRGQSMHVTGWASKFLFHAEQLDLPVMSLSGGEQSRVLLANLMLKPADVLVLDEPTNDLDIPTLEVLEESLETFAGAIVLVTHDRHMLNRLCTELIALDGNGNAKIFAGLWQWEETQDVRNATPVTKRLPVTLSDAGNKSSTIVRAKKLTWNEQREWDGLEAAIEAAERDARDAETLAADPNIAAHHVRARAAYEQLHERQRRIESLYNRWAELEAKQQS